MRAGSYWLVGFMVLFVTLVSVGGCATKPLAGTTNRQLVIDHFSRFNAHDINGMQELVWDDVAWYTIERDEMVANANGIEELTDGLTAYFEALPSVRAQIEHIHSAGSFAVARERVVWLDKEGVEQSQASYSVYQIRDGKIESIWYFAAEE